MLNCVSVLFVNRVTYNTLSCDMLYTKFSLVETNFVVLILRQTTYVRFAVFIFAAVDLYIYCRDKRESLHNAHIARTPHLRKNPVGGAGLRDYALLEDEIPLCSSTGCTTDTSTRTLPKVLSWL